MSYGKEYEKYRYQYGLKGIRGYYQNPLEIPKDKDGAGMTGTGTRSLFNRYSIFFLNDGPVQSEDGKPKSQKMNYFDEPGLWKGESFNKNTGLENLSIANIIQKCSDGNHNGMDYEWSDFIYTKHYQKLTPANHLITLRRFGSPVGDNLFSKLQCTQPDISRAVGYIDGENNKLEDLMKFSVGFNWEEKESQVQELQATSYGTENNLLNGKWNTWSGRAISALNNEDEGLLRNDSQIESFDPFSNKNNLVFGPLDVIMKMMVRGKGLNFNQDITLTFEYELSSYDGINPKVAFLDLISNLLILTYNRGEFWGGDYRYIGGKQRRSLLGDDALDKLRTGDFQGFLETGGNTLFEKFNNLSNGLGFSLEGLQNFGKNMLGNFGNMLVAGGLNKIGRPELQSLEALLTGEPTGQWHLTIGNPFNPTMMIGNLVLENTDFEFMGPFGYDDFPTKLKITCTLKHGRPRDRTDIMSMLAPQVGRMYYTEPPNSTIYAMNNSSSTKLNYKEGQANKAAEDLRAKIDQELITNLKDVQSRFPNHINNGKGDEKISWAAQWTT